MNFTEKKLNHNNLTLGEKKVSVKIHFIVPWLAVLINLGNKRKRLGGNFIFSNKVESM